VRGGATSVLVRGVRWRLMGSLLVVITAAIAVGAAVVGPLFLRAGGDSLVRQAVAAATVSNTSFELDSATHSSTLDGLAAERQLLLRSGHLLSTAHDASPQSASRRPWFHLGRHVRVSLRPTHRARSRRRRGPKARAQ
jgi:hypothetical protein